MIKKDVDEFGSADIPCGYVSIEERLKTYRSDDVNFNKDENPMSAKEYWEDALLRTSSCYEEFNINVKTNSDLNRRLKETDYELVDLLKAKFKVKLKERVLQDSKEANSDVEGDYTRIRAKSRSDKNNSAKSRSNKNNKTKTKTKSSSEEHENYEAGKALKYAESSSEEHENKTDSSSEEHENKNNRGKSGTERESDEDEDSIVVEDVDEDKLNESLIESIDIEGEEKNTKESIESIESKEQREKRENREKKKRESNNKNKNKRDMSDTKSELSYKSRFAMSGTRNKSKSESDKNDKSETISDFKKEFKNEIRNGFGLSEKVSLS